MFDDPMDSGFDLKNSKRSGTAIDRLPVIKDAQSAAVKSHKLDSFDMQQLHHRLMAFYIRELRRQETNRYEQDRDEEFYDNNAWSDTDKQVLKERGQVPLNYNVIAPMVNWITGTEKRTRTDYRILPRRKDGSKPAERKTQLMKYLGDVNRFGFAKSRAFEDAVKVGVGWLEGGGQDESDGEIVYARSESWRNMLWDSASIEKDMSDCRYEIRVKWVDTDIADSMFKDRSFIIHQSAIESDRLLIDSSMGDTPMDTMEIADGTYRTDRQDFDYRRKRLRLIEIWFRAPVNVRILKGGDFGGDVYEEGHPSHDEAISSGQSVVISKVKMRMHCAIMAQKGLLWVSQSPYRHNDFPFTPIWCYRRGKDGLPYGVIRGVRDLQDDVNKRASKALHILSTNKTIMEEGAVPDIDEYVEEVARPDAVIVKKKGYELELNVDRDLSEAHMQLMSRSIEMIQSVSGVTDENMGRQSNATSGKAIQARQSQGSLATTGIFDNLRLASQMHGEKELSLIEQFFTEQKAFRITNMRGTPEYVNINDGMPENDIVRTKADFVISEDDWNATIRQNQVEELIKLLMELAPVAPQIVVVMLDLLVEKMDIPNRDEIVRRIRQATGMRDPDQEQPTPEDIAKAKEQARQKQLQDAMQQAELDEKVASTQLKRAQAGKAQADANDKAQRIAAELAGLNVESQKAAIEAALLLVGAPPAAGVADGLLHEAGFKSRSEQEDEASLQQAMEQHAQRQQAAVATQQAQQQQVQQAGNVAGQLEQQGLGQ
ncbi:hypothetical protein [Methylosinus sp. PW1]|uniref:portal protein n=1 Tax=Methylosinus sp. PW1 TaxID=107636 RepID=UPI0005647309|nr:hypothetical protein [Methylosinus sp. PW1]